MASDEREPVSVAEQQEDKVLEKEPADVQTTDTAAEPAAETQASEASPAEAAETSAIRPESPFVSNLRMQVASSREPGDEADTSAAASSSREYKSKPSVGTWLSPRSPRERRQSKGSVNFAEENEVVPISGRKGRSDEVYRRYLELSFKGTCAKPFKLEKVDASLTVRNVKELCEAKCLLPPDSQRLLYKGAILQDCMVLQDTHLPDKATLFLVKGASASSQPKEPPPQPEMEPCEDECPTPEGRQQMAMMCIECGVNPGRLLTDGLCSICFRELVMRENAALKQRREDAKRKEEEATRLAEEKKAEEEEAEAKRQKNTTRCYKCNKKTGLTGFLCKCGYYYCAAHRYAEEHDCVFDHKAHGRELLAQQNQKVESSSFP